MADVLALSSTVEQGQRPDGVRALDRMLCRRCGANPARDSKVALVRVNEKGVPGIWECAPYCIPDRLSLQKRERGRVATRRDTREERQRITKWKTR
jgi:hypothetical protein